MATPDRGHIDLLIQLVRAGGLTRSEVGAFATYLRGRSEPGSLLNHLGRLVLLDIPQGGFRAGYLHDFVVDLVDDDDAGARSRVLFPAREVIEGIGDLLDEVGADYDRSKLGAYDAQLAPVMATLLGGTEFTVPDRDLVVRLHSAPWPHGQVWRSAEAHREGGSPMVVFPLLASGG